MTEKQELEMLKEIEENATLFKRPIIMWSDIDGLSYFNNKDLTQFFAKRFKYQCINDKKQFKQKDLKYLRKGAFNNLKNMGLPKDRAEYFLDPWNYQYWVKDVCKKKAKEKMRVKLIYSFGPNRKRDSFGTKLMGDDIGIYIYHKK